MKNIPVTQPFLPELDEFTGYLEEIWKNKWLTNCGPFHQQLESALCSYLGVKYVSLFNNATIALITALQALKIEGEVITTPYSFVATSHSIIWNKLKPVFVDIDPNTFNLDPNCIEKAITPETRAIMPVHCYSNPCDVEAIQRIADKHGLRVIYDAAHAFGINIDDESLLNYGDMSILSFHATKVFNTFEGGAIICHDESTKKQIDLLKNFGIADETNVTEIGLNGKMSEVNAAFGLVQLKHVHTAIEKRKLIDTKYRDELSCIKGISIPKLSVKSNSNYSYFPVLIEDDYRESRDDLYNRLKSNGILSRRYFYPLISNMTMYKDYASSKIENLPIANSISDKVLCLPIYHELSCEDFEKIVNILRE